MTDCYTRVGVNRPENPQPNEIRITTQGKMRKYILYAITLFEEKRLESIVLRAMGKTISKAVSIAEILKKRFSLHQITEIGSTEIDETYVPSVEGLDDIKHTKRVSSIQITLSTAPLDSNALGYQPPSLVTEKIPTNRPKPQFQNRGGMSQGRGGYPRRGRGGGRGGRGGFAHQGNQGMMPVQPQYHPNYDMDVRRTRGPNPGMNQSYPNPSNPGMNQPSMEFPGSTTPNFQGGNRQPYNPPMQSYNQGNYANQGNYNNSNQGNYGNQGNFNSHGGYPSQGYNNNQQHYSNEPRPPKHQARYPAHITPNPMNQNDNSVFPSQAHQQTQPWGTNQGYQNYDDQGQGNMPPRERRGRGGRGNFRGDGQRRGRGGQ